jgi:hypothetical protein
MNLCTNNSIYLKPVDYGYSVPYVPYNIQPTSTDSERVFSVARNFKTRRRIKFRVLNTLVFFKYYFLNIFLKILNVNS